MAYAPQHAHNPCSLSQNEEVPAKISELLRHNDHFKKAVLRLEKLEKRLRLEDGSRKLQPRDADLAMVRRLGEVHRFAGTAIQWLVPEPLFEISHVAMRTGLDLTGKEVVSLVTVKLQMGTTPDPEDKDHWRTFEAHRDRDAQSIANVNGRLWRRGPHLRLQKSEDPRFCSKVDPLQEWRDYFANGRKFTLDTPWRDSPSQFKREFCFFWRYLDSRATNPITGTRIDAPHQQEISFFKDRSLLSAIGKNTIEQEDLAHAFTLDNLGKHYRLFAFPESIRTRSEARRMAVWTFDQLTAKLPPRESELYGSPLQWDIFLTVQDLMRAGAPFDEALQESFEKIHLNADNWREGQPIPDQQRGWAQRGADWLNTYHAMDAPLSGEGLVQRIFPDRPNTPTSTSPA